MAHNATLDRPLREVNVLFVGDGDRDEFRQSRLQLDTMARVRQARDVQVALGILQAGFVPAVIVIAQAFPGELSPADVERLRRAAPLARLLGLLGSWCEGELRTGRPAAGVARLYWHQFPAQCAREFSLLHGGRGSTWALPVTVGEEERLLAAQAAVPAARDSVSSGLIAIRSRSLEMADWLVSACRLRGYSTVRLAPDHEARFGGVHAGIFNGCCCDASETDEIERFSALLREDASNTVPLVVLLDFPRIEDHNRAVAAGADIVLSKPLDVEDLFWQLKGTSIQQNHESRS